MNVVTFDPARRLPPPRGAIPTRKMFVVVEIVPGGKLRLTQPIEVKTLEEGRVAARDFMVLETEEEGIATASTLAAENPGRCFVCVELVAAAFEVAR
jgi:hypothetical protein